MRVGQHQRCEGEVVSRHRDTSIEFRRLLRGAEGSAENYELSLIRFTGVYTTPRYRHNYDQIRYAIRGDLNYAAGQDLPEGALGYFPEGTYYGPQRVPAMLAQLMVGLKQTFVYCLNRGGGLRVYSGHRRHRLRL